MLDHKALVVYESFWGNTAAVARAIAEGIGPEARALSTAEAASELVRDAELLVVGAPVIGFALARDSMRNGIAVDDGGGVHPPNLSAPSMRSWLEHLPSTSARGAAFETRIWWSPRGATGDIERGLERAGWQRSTAAARFVVKDKYGPLRDGELERARAWGEAVRSAVPSSRRS